MNTSKENEFVTLKDDNLSSGSIIGEIINNCANLVLFSFGTFIQLKIISTCRKEKNKTWQIDITHSVGMMILFFFTSMFEKATEYFPTFHDYTGVWICYVAAFIYISGTYVMLFHSLVVSLMKYVFIVHHRRVMEFGEEKTKNVFFWINILHILSLTIPTIYFFDFEAFLSIVSCFDLKEQLVETYNSSTGNKERMFMCKLNIGENEKLDSPNFYNAQQGFCAVKMIWVLAFSCNIPESYFYFTIFRQMRRRIEPSPDNVAPNSLADNVQIRNLRKLKINANVTFITWIFEWVANVFICASWIVNSKLNSNFGMGLNAMLWYYVILPNMYLMNTPHNKDRVIDDGFWNTVRNGLGLPFNLKRACISFRNNDQHQDENGENSTKPTRKASKLMRKPTPSRNVKTEVYALSKSTLLPLENQPSNAPNVSKETPSTSNGNFKTLERYQHKGFSRNSPWGSDEDERDTCIQTPLRLRSGKELMLHMKRNVNTEEVYLHYFLQLIKYEEMIKDDTTSENDFEIMLFQNSKSRKMSRSKSKGINKRLIEEKNLTNAVSSHSTSPQSVMLNVNLLGTALKRIELRAVILENCEDYCNDEESYSRYLTELIDLEEKLVQK